MKRFLFILFTLSFSAMATESTGMKKSMIGIKYFSQMMGNVHQNPSRYSQVLTTVSCNHPVKIMKETSKDGKEFVLYGEDKWNLVSVGPYEGYMMTDYLSDKKNDCFEEEFPKFFDGLSLDINDLYYWARLYDQYVQGKSKVRQ
ncbi:MAG: SH3 domain-containing protein [Bacteriovorax sp.]